MFNAETVIKKMNLTSAHENNSSITDCRELESELTEVKYYIL